jgi:hypothetical protein
VPADTQSRAKVKLKRGLNIIAVGKAPQSLGFRQCGAAAVTPAALSHEFVPNLDVLLGRSATVLKAPSQGSLVGSASQHLLGKFLITHTQKARASGVEPSPDLRADVVTSGKPTGSLKTNLIEHPPEIDDAAHLLV